MKKILLGILIVIVIACGFAYFMPNKADAQINTVVSAIWRRIGNIIATNPANLSLMVGTTTQYMNTTAIDKLFVDGTINSSFSSTDCIPTGQGSTLNADYSGLCGSYAAIEDSAGLVDMVADTAGALYFRLRPGASGSTVTAGDGIGISYATAFLKSATTTMAMEGIWRPAVIQNATSSLYYFGFADTSGLSPDYAAQPDGCMIVASSTRSNFAAICKNSSAITVVDTGVASSTLISGTGSWRRMYVNMSGETADFYIQASSTALVNVATITGQSVASTTALNPLMGIGTVTATGPVPEMHIRNLKTWYLDQIW